MMRSAANCVVLLLSFFLATTQANAQSDNLLQNPQADLDTQHWRATGQATVEEFDGKRCFVVRNEGHFFQDVVLPGGAAGKYAVLLGRGSSERVNPDGAITGLPVLYGYMLATAAEADGGRILEYLQGQQMLGSAKSANEWVKLWGIFKVPEGTGKIRFFLNQASRKGVPHNGSAARFDDLGLYLFATREEAKAFADR